MLRRTPTWPAADLCWKCQWRLTSQPQPQRRKLSSIPHVRRDNPPRAVARPQRTLRATQIRTQSQATAPVVANPTKYDPSRPIRHRLKLWQEEYGGPTEEDLRVFENYARATGSSNGSNNLRDSLKADEIHHQKHDNYYGEEDMDDGEGLVTLGLFLKPGDVVELQQCGRESVLAVFVQQIDNRSQFFSVNGRWCHVILRNIGFVIQGCIDPVLVQTLIPYLPTKPGEASEKDNSIYVPPEIGAPVRDILAHLGQASEGIYRTNASVLDNAYLTLADRTKARMMTLSQITKLLLKPQQKNWKPSPAHLLAVRKALLHDSFRFVSDKQGSQRLTNVFTVRPTNDVDFVEEVLKWVRLYQEHRALEQNPSRSRFAQMSQGPRYVFDFVEKARRLVAKNRKRRDPLPGTVGPNKTPLLPNETEDSYLKPEFGEKFSGSDKLIISFLQSWVLTDQFEGIDNLHSAGTTIVQATESYEDPTVFGLNADSPLQRDRGAGFLFLQEIGVVSPHENRYIYDEQLMLPAVRISRNLELLTKKAELTRINPDFRDSMAKLRHDWGELEVYCIDPEGAHEIDDGISISKVSGTSSEYWIHVHVANPTAFFDKTHVLSGLAAHMTETVYIPERAYSMLPSWASQDYFSLGRNRPVLTFSTRLDTSGTVLERKIQSGIIRRITSITPEEVVTYLGETSTATKTRLVVGGEVPQANTPRIPPVLAPSQLQDLTDLYTVARSLFAGRKAAGARGVGSDKSTIRLYEKPGQSGLTWVPPSLNKSRVIWGDPIIELTGQPTDDCSTTINPTGIVQEMMMLACQTAASWCAERNIPIIYRGTVESPTSRFTLEEFEEKILSPYLEKHDKMSPVIERLYMDAQGRAVAHSSPLPHRIIGAESYARVTSPLRRFSDMLAHWQIEAALRCEANTGRKLNMHDPNYPSRPSLPFSQSQVQASVLTLSPKEKMIDLVERHSIRHWSVMAFLRAFKYNEAQLPETFKVAIKLDKTVLPDMTGKPLEHAIGYIIDYNIDVCMKLPPGLEAQMGDEWEVKIAGINSFRHLIFTEPMRLLHREDIEGLK